LKTFVNGLFRVNQSSVKIEDEGCCCQMDTH
jgi:hypothetical protein